MELSSLMHVMYGPANYAAPCWLAKAGCAERQSRCVQNRLLVRHLALDCSCDPQWLESVAVAEFVDNWSQLRDAAIVLGLLALKAELLRSGYIRWLTSETLALLALPINLPVLPGRPSSISQETLTRYGSGYVLALARDLPEPLIQRLALVFPVTEARPGAGLTASTQFVFKLAVEHVKKYRIEARRPPVRSIGQAQGFAASPS